MWILTAIFQAIGQALTWILPISESGHSAVFHDFSSRFTDACSKLTGVIHIGIAIGIIIAFYKLFLTLLKNFFGGWNDLFHKRLDVKNPSAQRRFMYMTILSFVPMIFYAIPAGKYGNVYQLFHRVSYNGNLLGEGICIALTGVLIITAIGMKDKKSSIKIPPFLQALIIGVIAFLTVLVSGTSLVAGVLFIGMLLGMSDKIALRYSMVMSVMVLIVMGIVEICIGVTDVKAVAVILALVVSILFSFFTVKLLIFFIKNNYIKYFAWYDIVLGGICFIVGIFEIVLK